MQCRNITHPLLLAALLVVAAATTPAHAQVNVNITFGPPAAQEEPIPVLVPGHVWAPGYWAWQNDHYIWLRGRTIVQRPGYRWEPDRWIHGPGGYVRQGGRWERDQFPYPNHAAHDAKPKKPKKPHKADKVHKLKHRDRQESHSKKGD